jgi:hypothetical protein
VPVLLLRRPTVRPAAGDEDPVLVVVDDEPFRF